ncbi:MAG: pitrilysin family protein [bacterium]
MSGKHVWLIMTVVILFIWTASPLSAGSKISGTTLANGLNVLCIESHAAPLVSIYLWYRVGSRNENPGMTGISHLLEHLRFASSKNYPSGRIEWILTGLGADFGAFTGEDYTAYYESLPTQFLDLALKIEADRMRTAAIEPTALKQEIRLILPEAERDEKNIATALSRAVQAASFTLHPYRQPVLGYPVDIRDLTADMLVRHQGRYYTPRNSILVIAGDFEVGKAVSSIEKYFGAIPAGPVTPEVKWVEPEQKGERRTTIKGDAGAGLIEVAFRTPAVTDPDIFPLAVLDSLLASGKSSRLARALVEKELAVSVSSTLGYSRDPSLLRIRINLCRGIRHSDVEKILDSEFERLRTEEVSTREFQKAINQVTSGFLFSRDSAEDLARNAGYFSSICGDNSDMIEAFISGIPRLTPEDIKRVAQTYLITDRRTAGWFIPPNQNVESSIAAPSPAPRKASHSRKEASPASSENRVETRQPAANTTPPPPSPPSSAPGKPVSGIQRSVLDNGLILLSKENHENSTISFRVQVRAGSLYDPPKREGLAWLISRLIERGAGRRNAQEISEIFDYYGAEMAISTDRQTLTIQGRCQAGQIEPILETVSEIVQKPLLPDRELERVRSEILGIIKFQDNSPRAIAERELAQAIYPEDHPMHQSLMGTEKSVRLISRKDLLDFYRKCVRPDTTALALVGDLSSEEALALSRNYFGSWKAGGPAPEQAIPSVELPVSAETKTFSAGRGPQSFVLLGQRGISRTNPDFYAANLMNFILGGGPFSRLTRALCGKKPLAFSVASYFSPMLCEGPWAVRLVARPEDVEKATTAVLSEIERIRTRPVTPKELKDAKTYLINRLPLTLKDNSAVAEMLLHEELYGLGTDYIREYPDRYEKITAEEVQKAAKTCLRPEAFTSIIVNPQEAESENQP